MFRRLVARAAALGAPAPAALIGDWFGSRAVLVPSVALQGCHDAGRAFDTPTRQPPAAAAPGGAVGGGWVGYLGYGLTDPGGWRRALPVAAWGWTDHVLRCDIDGRWWFESLVAGGEPLAAEFGRLLAGSDPPPRPWSAGRLRRHTPAEHCGAVAGCVETIAEGEVFQANICTRFEGAFEGAPAELFATGTRDLRPARAAYLAGDWGAAVSFSPELFLARSGNRVRSMPIKGTLPRRGPADAGNAALLRQSTKDVAENVMIVDMVRNDLARACVPGTVTVPELLAVRPAPGVWHLSSTVHGTVRPTTTDADLLRAVFPPGSVTGAPKIRALELIAQLERWPREIYTGGIGMASPVSGMELNVAIRTFELTGEKIWLGVGGGVTADSDPASEWQECLDKAAPLEHLLVTGEP